MKSGTGDMKDRLMRADARNSELASSQGGGRQQSGEERRNRFEE